eukprot:768373-Hanusia_phi.AAC.10
MHGRRICGMVIVLSDGLLLIDNIDDAVAKCDRNCFCRMFMMQGLVPSGDKKARKLLGDGSYVRDVHGVQELPQGGEPLQHGDDGVEVPVGAGPTLPLPIAYDQCGVIQQGEGQGGARRGGGHHGFEVTDETGLVGLVVEAADEVRREGLHGAHHLGGHHARWAVDVADHVVGGKDALRSAG